MSSPPKTEFGAFNYIRDWKDAFEQTGWWHSFRLPDGTEIRGVNRVETLEHRLAQFPVPDDLHGKRVLDIGAWDGWFSFEMERRGAEVMAIDCWDNPRFHQIHAMLRSRVDYRQLDMYELTPQLIGQFDIVLFLGVLYHLKHPLLALERVCALTTDLAAVDSFILRDEHRPGEHVSHRPVMEFYETDEFGGEFDNWVGPSLPCLLALCRTAGFARVEWRATLENSACVACYRRFEDPQSGTAAPALVDVFHSTNFGINFRSSLDEYATATFQWDAERLTLEDVKPEVETFGVRPGSLTHRNGYWEANFKVPPGLASGWHEARIRVGSSGRSNALLIAVDLPVMTSRIAIPGISDGKTWKPNELDLRQGNVVSMWIAGLPENADLNNVRAFLDGRRIPVLFVERANGAEARQVNAAIPAGSDGLREVTVSVGAVISPAATLRVLNQ